MSEYQYYEFRTIDRTLSQAEMGELRKLSTRAEITSSSFTNQYHWGDFKGDPAEMMDRYFDAFVYFANWGTRRFMVRLPSKAIDIEHVSAFCDDECMSVTKGNEHLVIEFSSDLEGGDDWNGNEDESWMASLIGIRDELMRGDLRALYIGWLSTIQYADDDDDDDALEPPVPPGLTKLSPALEVLADFLRVSDEMIEVAAAASLGNAPSGPSTAELNQWRRPSR